MFYQQIRLKVALLLLLLIGLNIFIATSAIYSLGNGGFESSFTGSDLGNWVTTGNAQRVNWNKRTGNYSLVIKGTWDGQNPDNGGARQKVSVTAGTKYLLHF